ncbi:EpsG family protein [Erwinia tracheiphila]|uniref:Amylovoran biosynthesis protein AmsC n=1 Tax=Erwinia tracheiphila TaxID=65700 RepID=A0A0M2K6V2_9GAMM|nr:EpsG family protein [Erwinia tracheiphila]EOS96439.1 Exopolysaccharide biosynthesis protein [Erwinia tracheiphila PSU-1]KKF35120.1 amylovoran biosynthesis protein AmsC [Erwinia tracheiphila]UIA86776.1 EpsG family protein [Erwinia tracheiphila]UIA95132.1 EpsG family protein [Erwinia tracheiphila]
MAIYWIISYTLLVFCFFELATIDQLSQPKTKTIVTYFFFIGTVVLILLAGMRGPNSGIDDWQYLGFFHDFSRQTSMSGFSEVVDVYRYENVFMLLAWVLSWFTHESYFFLLFIAFVSVTTNAWIFKKYSPLILCSLCLYSAHLFINKDMNQIRFGLSSAFAVAAICTAAGRRYFLAFIFLLLSSQSQSTGFVTVVVVPFLFIKERKYFGIMMVFAAIPLGLVGGQKLFLDSLGVVPNLGDRAMAYSGTEFDTALPVFSLANFKNIAFIIFFTLVYFRKPVIEAKDRLVYMLLIAYSAGAAIRIIFSDFSILGGRVGNLFLHTEPLLLAFLMMRIRNPILNFLLLAGMTTYYLAYNTILSVQSVDGYSISPLFKIF